MATELVLDAPEGVTFASLVRHMDWREVGVQGYILMKVLKYLADL